MGINPTPTLDSTEGSLQFSFSTCRFIALLSPDDTKQKIMYRLQHFEMMAIRLQMIRKKKIMYRLTLHEELKSVRDYFRKRLGITVFQPRLKVCTFARTNYYEYGKQRQVQESP